MPANACFLQRLKATFKAFGSFSVCPFYGVILLTLLITYMQFEPAPAATNAGAANATSSVSPQR